MDWLNYHHLLYFWTTAREGSVTRAAERLMLAQPTISGQIKKLEQRIGQPLFERSGRELTLTETGRMVYTYADRIFSVGQELADALAAGGLGHPTHLRVGVSDALPKLVTCALIEPVLRANRTLKITCHEDRTERLLAELALHAFDIVLSDTPVGATTRVRAFNHPLGDCGVTFFGTSELVDTARPGFPGSLSKVPVLLPTGNTMLRRSLDRWFDQHDVHPRVIGEFEDSALLKVFGQRGAGVFPAPTIVRNEVIRQYDVQSIESIDDVREQFYAITLERSVKNPIVAEVCDTARDKLAAIDQ